MDELWDLMSSLNSSQSFEELESHLDKVFQQFDIEHYVYLNFSPLAIDVTSIGNYPKAWVNHYLEQEYQKTDPTAHACSVLETPFLWRNCDLIVEPNEKTKRFWQEAGEYSLSNGIGIPARNRDKSRAGWGITFASKEDEKRWLEHHESVISVVANAFHYRFEQLLFSSENLQRTFGLTQRERESVKWLCDGKTYSEIGQILSISERTARFHITSARTKLDVRTNAQLIAKVSLYRLV
ncbi:autoinducer binding domain-containing protein [Pontibacterium sp.]|uniref:helix-turn-helix transcriptional regulator n=1 Tax=Pontibacterium sp. TaxID=2036026 RepID=UPI003564D99E